MFSACERNLFFLVRQQQPRQEVCRLRPFRGFISESFWWLSSSCVVLCFRGSGKYWKRNLWSSTNTREVAVAEVRLVLNLQDSQFINCQQIWAIPSSRDVKNCHNVQTLKRNLLEITLFSVRELLKWVVVPDSVCYHYLKRNHHYDLKTCQGQLSSSS